MARERIGAISVFLLSLCSHVRVVLSQVTCTNGIFDANETGIDCGGVCPVACPSPSPDPRSVATPSATPAAFSRSTVWDDSAIVWGIVAGSVVFALMVAACLVFAAKPVQEHSLTLRGGNHSRNRSRKRHSTHKHTISSGSTRVHPEGIHNNGPLDQQAKTGGEVSAAETTSGAAAGAPTAGLHRSRSKDAKHMNGPVAAQGASAAQGSRHEEFDITGGTELF